MSVASRGPRWLSWLVGGCLLGGLLGGCAKGEDLMGGGFGGPGGVGTGNGQTETSDDGDPGADGPQGDACLMNNCAQDLECGGCQDGATLCDTDEGRCVQCDPENQIGCEAGEVCTDFGNCVPDGLGCPTADGLPTVNCNADADCAACDPQHQVCDTASNTCVACSDQDEDACHSVEHCEAGACVANCPQDCNADADCGACGGAGHEAHACNAHVCTQCNSANPCPGGLSCNAHGTCVEVCGLPGAVAGTCDADADCSGCPGDATHCVVPINGGHGTCGALATGCSDLGNGVVVLPEPFDQVTNACSDDDDCAGVGVQYNVGKLLRELTGLDSIDDANIEYPMNACAAATISVGSTSVSCGICVPCQEDNDCQDIDVDDVAGDAFGPLGAIASAILLDQLFGPNEHTIYMFCQPVAGDYGVCAPCPSLLSDCAGPAGGGGGSGECGHDTCTTGDPLDPSCGTCAQAVCEADNYCCATEWDEICTDHVETYCAGSCNGGDGGACTHSGCEAGAALAGSCSDCAATVCDADPYCCQTEWDEICTGLADDSAVCDCAGGGASGCAHDECSLGGPLISGCSACATAVCAADDYCCTTDWDQFCLDEAEGAAACAC
ncbi:MAG: hypothetical protein JKY37_28350 [Nannocystaceae bacterium]|nr:hypothetical protein [Nannocystaceae bacterium]